jgi:hypothetical protein
MPGIEISPVNSAAAKRQFLEFPYTLYRDDPNWVAPLRIDQKEILDPNRHPFYQHADMQCFLATSAGAVCGRIAAIVDRDANAARNERVGTFGFFESIESSDVAAALFASAKAWLSARGMTLLRGPMNPFHQLRGRSFGGRLRFHTARVGDLQSRLTTNACFWAPACAPSGIFMPTGSRAALRKASAKDGRNWSAPCEWFRTRTC